MYNAMIKRTEVHIEGISFFIAPFPVFSSARITAMLSKVLAPVLGGVIALLGGDGDEDETAELDEGFTAKDAADAIPVFVQALDGLNPNEFEKLMRELLVNSKNIAWQTDENPEGEILTEDTLNAFFAGNTQNIYVLAFHVLKVNFRGFFEKFKNLSGSPLAQKLKAQTGLTNTAI